MGHNLSFRGPLLAIVVVVAFLGLSPLVRAANIPKYDHIVLVIEENHDYGQIIGSPNAPYINNTLLGTYGGALFTDMHAETHPSEPNYLDLFSGSNQGVTDDGQYDLPPMTTPNLGGTLITKGYTFTGYAESLPSVGYTGATSGEYALKHAPWVNWQNSGGTTNIPSTDNVPFSSFPSDFTQLPTVSLVIPNLLDDMHDGTVQQGDTWLSSDLDAYAQWAKTHNSLLMVTWDEDGEDGQSNPNLIATLFEGAHVKPGNYSEPIDHYNLLSTLEDMYNLPYCTSNDATAAPVTDVFVTPEPSTFALLAAGGIGLLGFACRRRKQARAL